MKKIKLTEKQRLITAVIYIIILGIIFSIVGGNFSKFYSGQSEDINIWFYSGALLVILGSYIAEPYFSKPSDVIINSIVVLLALFGIENKNILIGYNYIFCFSISVLTFALLTIFLKESKHSYLNKISKFSYLISTNLGHNKFIFSLLYISAAITYFGKTETVISFVLILGFWICLIFFDVVGLIVRFISKLILTGKTALNNEIGTAIGCENPYLYKVEIDYNNHGRRNIMIGDVVALETKTNLGSLGVVLDKKQLLNKEWLQIYLIRDNNDYIDIDIKTRKLINDSNSIFQKENSVFSINSNFLKDSTKELLEMKSIYTQSKECIGFIDQNSNLEIISIALIDHYKQFEKLSEGSIVRCDIKGNQVLYQIIGAKTIEEKLENHDQRGYTIAFARKLGIYDADTNVLKDVNWLPQMYTPVFLNSEAELSEEDKISIAHSSIGHLPGTDFKIPLKDISSLVTHNTAILGILGIGKSCLAYELISNVTHSDIKVLCIDITNQYGSAAKGLPKYINEAYIFNGVQEINEQIDNTAPEVMDNKDDGGTVNQLHNLIKEDIQHFLDSEAKVRIINPDEIIAIQQTENAKNRNKDGKWEMYAPFSELTVAEITRVISEASLEICKGKGITDDARLLLVYEEAHAKIPEWNSIAYEGDKKAVNGTSKVILQGRKYGLGSFVITQRTANVAKSILNQCNTIFAMRVFDDTGKAFLENYFGKDYSDLLPNLEEREVVIVGKATGLKKPVIIKTNDLKYITDQNKLE